MDFCQPDLNDRRVVIMCYRDLLNINDLIDFDDEWNKLTALLRDKYCWPQSCLCEMQALACRGTRYEYVLPHLRT
jgi:hypothetical protein